MIKKEEIIRLKRIALACREDILKMTTAANSGHPGGSLSTIDIIVALYFYKMNIRPHEPLWPERDRFILSKGHSCPALYACLARRGYFPVARLNSFRSINSQLQGHPEFGKCRGIDASSGPLGQGLGVGIGMALAARLDKKKYRTYVMIGDGECDEGNIWESAMAAAHFRLSNLTAILDHNGLQIDGWNRDVMEIEPIAAKFKAFGWAVIEADGHDFKHIVEAFALAEKIRNKPSIIIAKTVKGKGVSMMENKAEWHGKACTGSELKACLRELEKNG
jgi:transketolase